MDLRTLDFNKLKIIKYTKKTIKTKYNSCEKIDSVRNSKLSIIRNEKKAWLNMK
jgi:hypothetical protein